MNNARFLNELDFVRIDWLRATNLSPVLKNVGGADLISSHFIRYRKELHLWQQFCVRTDLLFCDTKCFVLKHQFESNDDTKVVYCEVTSRVVIVGLTVDELLVKAGHNVELFQRVRSIESIEPEQQRRIVQELLPPSKSAIKHQQLQSKL